MATRAGSTILGAIACLLAANGDAVVYICMKKVAKDIHPAVILNWLLMSTTMLAAGIGVPLSWAGAGDPQLHIDLIRFGSLSFEGWAFCAGVVLCGIFTQIALALGLQRAEAGPASVVRAIVVAFVFMWQVTILKQPANALSAGGAALVVAGATTMALATRNRGKSKTAPYIPPDEGLRAQLCPKEEADTGGASLLSPDFSYSCH